MGPFLIFEISNEIISFNIKSELIDFLVPILNISLFELNSSMRDMKNITKKPK